MTNNIICEPQNMSNNRRFKYVGVQRNMRQEASKERQQQKEKKTYAGHYAHIKHVP